MEVYLDDDTDDDRLISTARRHGHRLLSPRSLGLRGSHDAVHLREAIQRRLPLLTRNQHDFRFLHELVVAAAGTHFGILIVCRDNDPRRDMSQSDVVQAITKLEQSMPDLRNQLVILNQWK